jgi:hypothetical protein
MTGPQPAVLRDDSDIGGHEKTFDGESMVARGTTCVDLTSRDSGRSYRRATRWVSPLFENVAIIRFAVPR